jgi:hypothetical protein
MGGNYWHGGPRGLKGWILPSSETGAHTTADYGAEKVCRRDCVYVTNNRVAAEMFGSMAPAAKVSIYLVQPYGNRARPGLQRKGIELPMRESANHPRISNPASTSKGNDARTDWPSRNPLKRASKGLLILLDSRLTICARLYTFVLIWPCKVTPNSSIPF